MTFNKLFKRHKAEEIEELDNSILKVSRRHTRRYLNGCRDKVFYTHRKHALNALALMIKFKHDDTLEYYHCPFCSNYHLGHSMKNKLK